MCQAYVALGLPPERFWQITPRLYDTEMKGAVARRKSESALVWWGAMLPHLKEPVSLDRFVNGKEDTRKSIAAWSAAWDRVDAGLAEAKRRRRPPSS